VPDRHRHDEFLWALIFSLLINLLFVFALLAPRSGDKAPGLQPLVISIAPRHQQFPKQVSAIPGPPAKTEKMLASPPIFRPQSASIDPALPARNNAAEATGSALPATGLAATVLSPLAPAGESATATIAKETAQETTAGLSIGGDKMAEDHYTAAEYLDGEKPPYPKRAERNGWEGTVLLRLAITAAGAVEKVEIAETSGYELLDQQARASVSAWRFKPARRNGIAIAATVQQPILFRSSSRESLP
jgi:protein TonB